MVNRTKKIFFFDIDNTLLSHQTRSIPKSALQAIDDLKADGHMIAIATGRGYGHAKEFIEQVNPAYAITHNGARVLRGQQEVHTTPLHHLELVDLFQLIESKGFCYGFPDGEMGHVSALIDEAKTPLDSVKLVFQADLGYSNYHPEFLYQAWLFFHERYDEMLLPELLVRYSHFDYVRWHETAIDILPKGVNKMTGCAWVLLDSDISVHHAYAFGDGLNDIEMLQGVGTGIAMGNAHPRLKAVAHRVAESIEQDGLAKMVQQLQREFALENMK